MPNNLVSQFTLFEETVGQGIGPNGTSGGTVSTSAEWVAAELAGTAFQVPHLASSLALDSLKKDPIYPESPRVRIFQTQRASYGLSNAELSFQSYLTGRGSALANGVSATAIGLSRLLGNSMGGVTHTPTRTLTGGPHTSTVVTVDDATGLVVGAGCAWEDSDGLCHPRIITDITGDDVTLNYALPATPVDTDLLRGGTTLTIDEGVITDTSSNLGSTLSGCLQKGSNGSAGFEVNGAKLGLASMTFGRNDYPTLDFSTAIARFTNPATGPSPTLPAATYPAPQVIGPDTQVHIADFDSTTLSLVCNGAATVDPGIPVVSQECMTARTGNMEGIGLYSTEPADTTVDLDVFPRATAWFTDQDAETDKQVSIVRLGASGSCFGAFFRQCELAEVSDGSGDFTSSVLKLRAVEVTAGTTAVSRSKIAIFLG